jgi:hypothetical protein
MTNESTKIKRADILIQLSKILKGPNDDVLMEHILNDIETIIEEIREGYTILSGYAQWNQVNPDTLQYCKKLNPAIFEYKEKDKDQETIDLYDFTWSEVENIISAYGYTIDDDKNKSVWSIYGAHALQIIAECLYESN